MTTTADTRLLIAREWHVSNPMPAFKPVVKRERTEFAFDFFNSYYRRFITEVLPAFERDPGMSPTEPMDFLKDACEQPCSTPFLYEMLLRQFLLSCQKVLIHLFGHPSLTKASLMHSVLVSAAGLIVKRSLSVEMVNFCDMMLAEVLDMYQSNYSDLLDSKFWSKTRTGEDLINRFHKKETGRLRLLNDYTFRMFAPSLIRKAVESAPASSIGILSKWAADNNILMIDSQ